MKRTLLLTALALMGTAAAKTLKITHFQPGTADQPAHAASLAFKAYVEQATGKSLEVQIYPASQLGDATAVLEGMKLGTVQMGIVHDGGIAPVFKPIDVLSIPYLFQNKAQAWRVLDGAYGKTFGDAMLRATGIRLLGFGDNGVRHFTNDTRPITKPADLRGLKIRVQPSPAYQRLVESLGASSAAIPWTELPTALQQGVVDGQENGVTNILAASLYQYQKYVTLDAHVQSVHAYLIADQFYSGLTAREQQAVRIGTQRAVAVHRRLTDAQDRQASALLKAKGMTVTSLNAAQIGAFRTVAQPAVVSYLRTSIDPKFVDDLLKAVGPR